MSNIADKLQDLVTAKADMKAALQEKGVTPTGGLSTYADAISRIKGEGDSEELKLPNGLKFAYSTCNNIPFNIDTSDYTNMDEMFYNCDYLITIPPINTYNVTSMRYMFSGCNYLSVVPPINTYKVTDMTEMFRYCSDLKSIQSLDMSNVELCSGLFDQCLKLETIEGLENLGKNIKQQMHLWYMFRYCYAITRDSVVNIFNTIYDMSSSELENPTLKFESEVIQRLNSDDIAIATNKGWTISSY